MLHHDGRRRGAHRSVDANQRAARPASPARTSRPIHRDILASIVDRPGEDHMVMGAETIAPLGAVRTPHGITRPAGVRDHRPAGRVIVVSTTIESQPVLTPLTEAAVFLVFTVDADGENRVRELLEDVGAAIRTVAFRIPDGELACVVGIGSDMWDRLFTGPRPRELHPFRELSGATHTAPSTPGDLLVHLRARRMDLCFELARQLADRLGPAAHVVDETHGFKYFDERDLLGFVDGTESPRGVAALHAAIVGDEDPQFAGGSYAVAQKYLHDLAAWNVLTVEQQEKAIGRSKLENVEQPDEQKASNAHLVLNTLDEDGNQLQIVRDNMPFGRVGDGEFGTYFISYAARVSTTERMLENMFIGVPEGNHDRLLDFSRAVTGGLFFVPSATFFDDLPAAPSGPTPSTG
jgi:porphyrinogen peroxidase